MVALVVQVFHELRNLNDLDSKITYEYSGRQYSDEQRFPSTSIQQDWPTSTMRDYVFEEALLFCGLVSIISSKMKLNHARSLSLNFKSGDIVRIRLDQGFGYWKPTNNAICKFNFKEGDKYQAERLVSQNIDVVGNKDDLTHFFIKHIAIK